ncbi:MAG: ExbD/TolR family protein [Kiritimatiellia bacterium]|jgi:biopolymer transport protein ExbD
MARKPRNTGENPKLDMTAMIDVVFQLLIFFIVTLKQEDICSKLSAYRPAPDKDATAENQPELVNIVVSRSGFIMRGRPVTLDGLERDLALFARQSRNSPVLIRCTADSPHAYLVQALDICNKVGMTNLSIFSM